MLEFTSVYFTQSKLAKNTQEKTPAKVQNNFNTNKLIYKIMAKFIITINGKNTNSYKSKSVAISTFWRKAQQLHEGSEILLYNEEGKTLYELYIG